MVSTFLKEDVLSSKAGQKLQNIVTWILKTIKKRNGRQNNFKWFWKWHHNFFNNTARKLAHSGCMCIMQCLFESCCRQTGISLVSQPYHIFCQCSTFCYQWEGVKKWHGKLGTKGKSRLLDTCTVFNNFVRMLKLHSCNIYVLENLWHSMQKHSHLWVECNFWLFYCNVENARWHCNWFSQSNPSTLCLVFVSLIDSKTF